MLSAKKWNGGVAHCPFENLADLRETLDEIRAWPGIRERHPGIFYLTRVPCLHFHIDKSGRRSADARDGAEWGAEIEISIGASRAMQIRFAREVKRRYLATSRPRV